MEQSLSHIFHKLLSIECLEVLFPQTSDSPSLPTACLALTGTGRRARRMVKARRTFTDKMGKMAISTRAMAWRVATAMDHSTTTTVTSMSTKVMGEHLFPLVPSLVVFTLQVCQW